MTSHLFAVCIDASRPRELADFWSGVLGLKPADDGSLLPGFRLRFMASDEPRRGPNQTHFDLTSSSPEDQQETVARALRLGARHIDVGQRPEEGHVVLADPEGNEFCVVGPGNNFLAGCGFLGALSCDGTRAVGYFWSRALGWPLVWDQDEETAIQSPRGGTKIAWGGPPVNPKLGRNRLRLALALPAGGDPQAEIDRLVALGATLTDRGGDSGEVELTDPDGNEFVLLTRP